MAIFFFGPICGCMVWISPLKKQLKACSSSLYIRDHIWINPVWLVRLQRKTLCVLSTAFQRSMLYNSLTLIMMLVDRKNRGYDSYFIIFLNFSRIRQKSASWPPILMKKCLVQPLLLTVTADCFGCSKSRFRLWKNSCLHPRFQR